MRNHTHTHTHTRKHNHIQCEQKANTGVLTVSESKVPVTTEVKVHVVSMMHGEVGCASVGFKSVDFISVGVCSDGTSLVFGLAVKVFSSIPSISARFN